MWRIIFIYCVTKDDSVLTCNLDHDDAPPNRPSPTNQAKQHREKLTKPDNQINDEGADSRFGSVVLRKSRLTDAQAKQSAQNGT